MPRIQSIKTTTVYLPPARPISTMAGGEPVTLEVLMMAQKIARDRGQVFDIEAFMPVELKDEWEAVKRGETWPKVEEKDDGPSGSGVEGGVKVENGEAGGEQVTANGAVEEGGLGEGDAKMGENSEESTTKPEQSTSDPAAPSSDTLVEPLSSTIPTDSTQPPTEPASATPTPTGKQPFKLTPNHPALLNLHWKQRQKRLAQLAARDAAIERGQVPEYYPELEAMIRVEEEREKEREREEEVGQKRKRGLSAADIEGIRASASHWNHLLVEARRARGPQWDYNTQQYLVDRSTEDFYTHMKPPRAETVIKQDPQFPQQHMGMAMTNGHGTPSSAIQSSRPLPPSRHSQSSSPVKPGMQMPPPNTQQEQMLGQRRMSAASNGNGTTPASRSGPLPPANYQPSPQQQSQQMYGGPPPSQYQQPPQQQQQQHQQQHQQQQQQQPFNPAQFLALQQQQQNGPNPGAGMMNPALLMQAQQRLQQQRAAGGGMGVNMAALMAGQQGQGQGQGQGTGWNPNMGLSPAMMQSMGVGMGGGASVGGQGQGQASGWNTSQ